MPGYTFFVLQIVCLMIHWDGLLYTMGGILHIYMFIVKTPLGKLPSYIANLLMPYSNSYCTRSQSFIRLKIPKVHSEFRKRAFSFMLLGLGMISKLWLNLSHCHLWVLLNVVCNLFLSSLVCVLLDITIINCFVL